MRNGHFVQKGFALGIHRYASLKCQYLPVEWRPPPASAYSFTEENWWEKEKMGRGVNWQRCQPRKSGFRGRPSADPGAAAAPELLLSRR